MSHEFFNAMADLVMTAQHLIERGWKFEFDHGERKFNSSKMIARNGDKERVGYEGCGVEGFLESIIQEELREWEEKQMNWFKTAPRGPNRNPCCPQCGEETKINRYDCDCGWKL